MSKAPSNTCQSGPNELTIIGLSPTVDEHSIKVEGTGAAIITNISTELLPNREIFQEIYPDDEDEDETEEETDADESDDDKTDNDRAYKALDEKLAALVDEQKTANELVASAESRLKILDAFGKSLDRKRGLAVEDGVETYRVERDKTFQDHLQGMVREREIMARIDDVTTEQAKLARAIAKEKRKKEKVKEKARKIKEKERQKEDRKKAEARKEKERIRKERLQFWPKQVYRVRISLDATVFTPMSSRRNSISSDLVKLAVEKQVAGDDSIEAGEASSSSAPGSCDITLTYVTGYAYWTPNYDLSLSTLTNTGALFFDAQLTNLTSEAWNSCKVILSTSQTDFSSLNDTIPTLQPWRVKVAPKGVYYNDIMDSREERAQKQAWQAKQNNVYTQKDRSAYFAVDQSSLRMAKHGNAMPPPPPPAPGGGLPNVLGSVMLSKRAPAPQQQMQQQQMAFGGGGYAGFGGPQAQVHANNLDSLVDRSGALSVGGAARFRTKETARKSSGAMFASSSARRGGAAAGAASSGGSDDEEAGAGAADDDDFADDGKTIGDGLPPELDFAESSFEETGLTTTFDLPGLKTLVPSSTASRQRVARVSFAGVVFSHTVVAKYTPAAYLKAKLRNASKLTLLKGPAGLTLDGSFMGRTSLPRCSAGDSFVLSLGVDPAVKVAYPKPDVKRSTTGIISKEDSSVYTRTITISNTRSGPVPAAAGASGGAASSSTAAPATTRPPITLTVLDQVPVSEDSRLRVDLSQPRGLVVKGAPIPTGVPGRDGKDDREWGRATAQLKKGGEVCWDVTLLAGRAVKLSLEYEVALPTGENVQQVA